MLSTKTETGQTGHTVSKYQYNKHLEIFKRFCTIWVRRYIWAWLQLAGLFPSSMACWDIVAAAPEELEFWVRPISCAVTGDAGKVIWFQCSIIIKKNKKRKMTRLILLPRAGHGDQSDTDTYWVLGNAGRLMNQTAAGWRRWLSLTDWSLECTGESSQTLQLTSVM